MKFIFSFFIVIFLSPNLQAWVDCRSIDDWTQQNYQSSSISDSDIANKIKFNESVFWQSSWWSTAEPGTNSEWTYLDTCGSASDLADYDNTQDSIQAVQDSIKNVLDSLDLIKSYLDSLADSTNKYADEQRILVDTLEFNQNLIAISSQTEQSSSSVNWQQTDVDWQTDTSSSKRCNLTSSILDNKKVCFSPKDIDGKTFTLPSNITRASKDMFTLCNIVEGQSIPTALVYVLDNTGSMKNNDPNKIAAQAIRNSLAFQAEKDPFAVGGAILFSLNASNTEEFSPVSLNQGTNLKQMQYKFKYNNGGGTVFLPSITLANQWLSDPKLDGYRKAIILISDGVASDVTQTITTVENSSHVVHGIYLGDIDDPGKESLKKVAEATIDTSDNTKGSFTHINQPRDMEKVIANLISSLVSNRTPVAIQVENSNTNQTITGLAKNFIEQSDGTWNVGLSKSLDINQGNNNFIFRTIYEEANGDSTLTEINFNLNVSDQIVNTSFDLEGTPFSSQCFDRNILEVSDANGIIGDVLTPEDSIIHLHFETAELPGYGDTIDVVLFTDSRDTLWVRVPLTKTSDTTVVYSLDVKLHWLEEEVDPSNQLLEVKLGDKIYAAWIHPEDSDDFATSQQKSNWQAPFPQTATLYDNNGDGTLDSVVFKMNKNVEEWMYYSFDFKTPWLTPLDSTLIPIDIQTSKFGVLNFSLNDSSLIMQHPLDSTLLYWIPPSDSFALFTGLPDDSISWKWNELSQNGSLVDSGKIILIDSMSPRIFSANVRFSNTRPDEGTLTLNTSEPIDPQSGFENPSFDFWINNSLQESYSHPIPSIFNDELKIKIKFKKENLFLIHPNDSVRFKWGDDNFKDLSNNNALVKHPLIEVVGELPDQVQASIMGVISSDDQTFIDSTIIISLLAGNEDGQKVLESTQSVGVSWGPIKISENTPIEERIFHWKILIFDQIGQFIASDQGKVDCTSIELEEKMS
ncbi:hypothetical protein OAA91_00090 [Fibrobacterales bacterium]|nr:hypothetical protein [Fibrobacterales bacterium]